MKAEVGDKVRLKGGDHRGERGVISVIVAGQFLVRLEGLAETIPTPPENVTNYSLAARKAWKTEPHRNVGRRKGTRLVDRVSVTLRLDRDLWQRFLTEERAGKIGDRTEVVNRWFREKLAELDARESRT